ncbi:MAG: hypothetical protein VKJ44_09035 [Synechococcus sp.]|nr:hypothetical protein [Synechococcus sp.]
MLDLQPTTATARSVALRLAPQSDLLAGDSLRITTSPDAYSFARSVENSGPVGALATARGIGAGYSRYYAGLADASFFNSLDLSIASGGGLFDGTASATAYASGRGDTDATAIATNVGLANVSYLDRYGGALFLGNTASPLAAIAKAGTGSVLGPLPGTTATATITADATVRGLEGTIETGRSRGSDRLFYGQPNSVVRASSELQLVNATADQQAFGTADATGLENSTILSVPRGNGDGTASFAGDARVDLRVVGTAVDQGDAVSLNGSALGVDSSVLYGSPTLGTTTSGRGVAVVDISAAQAAGLRQDQINLQRFQGIGITNSQVFGNTGADVIRGFGGYVAPQFGQAVTARADAAGINASGLYTGTGNDVIFGKVLNELEADLDADGDGIIEEAVFLDDSAKDGGVGGFDGIRYSSVNTGMGNDVIVGASNGSHFYMEIGNDTIDLDRSKASSLWGGLGNDLLRINGPSQANVLWGGLGNDSLEIREGDDNVFDGGLGQDVSTGGSGVDRFIFSEGASALLAASTPAFGEDLTELPFWATLSDDQKTTFWDTGVLRNAAGSQVLGTVDTVRNFTAGSGGDVMEINSAMASITQDLWTTRGTLFGVGSTGQLNVIEASADGSNRLGVVMGSLADINKLGIGSPSIAYATDTRQLMFDADGDWSRGSVSLGTVNVTGTLTKSNFAFGGTTAGGLGAAPTATAAVG